MRRQEREQLENSVGHLISINSFFSTTRNRDVAETIYLGEGKVKHELDDYILFEIDANPAMVTSKQRPFADISSFSELPEEEEVLFMLGSIFQITEVCCKDSSSFAENDNIIWIFKMKLCPEDQHELKAVFQDLKNEYSEEQDHENEVTINSFAIVIFEMHKFELADKFFRRLLRELPRDDQINRARCYHNIGNVALQQGHLKRSLKFFQRTLDLYEENHPRVATTNLCLGNLFLRKKNYRKALQYYNRALFLYEQHYGQEHPRVAICYGNIGSMLSEQRRWIEARDYVEKCLAIQQKCFSQIGDHPQIAYTHASLGIIYKGLADYDRAIEHEEKALQIRLKLLPHDHQLIIHSYNNLVISYDGKGDFIKSTKYFQQAEAIKRQQGIRTRQIFYRCPRCNRYVWVHPIFRICEGLTCFKCRREQFLFYGRTINALDFL
jgi:tetratricopeptide (TPR) repeat protein